MQISFCLAVSAEHAVKVGPTPWARWLDIWVGWASRVAGAATPEVVRIPALHCRERRLQGQELPRTPPSRLADASVRQCDTAVQLACWAGHRKCNPAVLTAMPRGPMGSKRAPGRPPPPPPGGTRMRSTNIKSPGPTCMPPAPPNDPSPGPGWMCCSGKEKQSGSRWMRVPVTWGQDGHFATHRF